MRKKLAQLKNWLGGVAKHHDWLLMSVIYCYFARVFLVLLVFLGSIARILKFARVSNEVQQLVETVFLTVGIAGAVILLVCVPAVGFLEWWDEHKSKKQHF
jgi:hypothetical protein